MKKFRMMLPVLAVVFAIASAVGGDLLLPITQGYYKILTNCSQNQATLIQANCQTDLPSFRPACTVDVAGHPAAYVDNGCLQPLRFIPQ